MNMDCREPRHIADARDTDPADCLRDIGAI